METGRCGNCGKYGNSTEFLIKSLKYFDGQDGEIELDPEVVLWISSWINGHPFIQQTFLEGPLFAGLSSKTLVYINEANRSKKILHGDYVQQGKMNNK